jgi:putative transposase
MEIAVSHDRQGEFEPQIIKKHQRRFNGFDNLILSLYSRGLSTREIESHIEEICGVEVSPIWFQLLLQRSRNVLENGR